MDDQNNDIKPVKILTTFEVIFLSVCPYKRSDLGYYKSLNVETKDADSWARRVY